jgi:hypothetical protein
MRSGRALAIVVLGLVVTLAGCADDGGEPVVLPTETTGSTPEPSVTSTSPTPSTSTAPTPTPTLVLPDEHVPEVDEFVRQFFAAYNAAQDSGDFTAFDAMYLPQCAGCLEMRAELEGWLADGGSVDGADWVILQQSSVQLAPGNHNALVLGYRTAGELVDSDAEPTEVDPVGLQLFNMNLNDADPLVFEDVAFGPA